ncbi:MAG: acyltransferase [Chitinophagales bacterium]|nr:acyltransferase [Chitinophagaceae bacterium]MCB9065258.1 acyltransferase [Chitinophagales bacterium]
MKYIKGYDGLRAFSILFVVLTHMGLDQLIPDSDFMQQRAWLLFSGLTGVQIFFSLSGFLITRILLIEKKQTGTISFKNFYIRRFLRLLPPLVVFYIAIAILMKMVMIRGSAVGFVMGVTYIYNFIPKQFYTGELGHMWSLAVEEQYYLLWPVVLVFTPKARKLIGIAAVLLFLCIIAKYILPDMQYGTETLGDKFLVDRWFVPAVAPIMIGSLFAILVYKYCYRLKDLLHENNKVLLLALLLYAAPLYLSDALLSISYLFIATGVSLFLTWLFFNQTSGAGKFLDFAPLRYIGKISYGIYVYQGFFLRTGPAEGLSVQQFPYNIILTIVIAIISYELLEKPVLKLKNKFR